MVYVIGCNHGIQTRDDDPFDNHVSLDQKRQFGALLQELIGQANPAVVAEEWGLDSVTRARDLAEGAGLIWGNVNTSARDLDELGIPNNYVHSDAYTAEQKECWNSQREVVMRRKFVALRPNRGNALLICGFDHMTALSDALREAGEEVEIIDYRNLEWYDPDAFPI